MLMPLVEATLPDAPIEAAAETPIETGVMDIPVTAPVPERVTEP